MSPSPLLRTSPRKRASATNSLSMRSLSMRACLFLTIRAMARDAEVEAAKGPRASLERAARGETVAPVVEDAAAREEKRAKEEIPPARRERALRAREGVAAEALAVAAVAPRAVTDLPDNTKAMRSVRKGLPEEKDSRAVLRATDQRPPFSVVREEAAVVASVMAAEAPSEAMSSPPLTLAEPKSPHTPVRDAAPPEAVVAVAVRALLSEAREENDTTTATALLGDMMTATALREVERDAEVTVVAPEARPEELPQPLSLEVLLLY